jgi:WD40 repeat protein
MEIISACLRLLPPAFVCVLFCVCGIESVSLAAVPYGDVPLPSGARSRLGDLRYRHPGPINSSALSPDCKLLATTGNGNVVVWDLQTGRRVQYFRNCGSPLFRGQKQVAFSPDGNRLAHACAFDVAARVWDLTSGKLAHEMGLRPGKAVRIVRPGPVMMGKFGPRTDPIGGLQYGADGKEVLIYGDTRLSWFDARNGSRLARASLPAAPSALSTDGKRCAVILDEGGRRSVLICATDTGREEARFGFPLRGNQEWHALCAFAPNGKSLTTAEHHQGIFCVWDLAALRMRHRYLIPPLGGRLGPFLFSTLAYSPDGRAIYVGTVEGSIHGLDLTTGKPLAPLMGHASEVTGLHFTRDGKTLISTSMDATVRRWDLIGNTEIALPDGYAGSVCTAVSPDGKRAAVGDLAGRLDLWDAGTGHLLQSLRATGAGIQKLAFTLDGKVLAAGCRDGIVRLFNADSGKETAQLQLPNDRNPAAGREFNCLAFDPDGHRLLTISRHDALRLWEITTAKSLWNAGLAKQTRAVFTLDGQRLLVGDGNAELACRETETGSAVFSVPLLADPDRGAGKDPLLNALALSPDGKLLASAHHDGSLRFWEPNSGRELKRLWGHSGEVWAVRFSPDGGWIVSAGSDGAVRIWEVITNQEVRKFAAMDGGVLDVEFSPDARTILTAGTAEALVWDVRPGRTRARDLEALWDGLRASDAARAFAAVCTLIEQGTEAVTFLRKKIPPVQPSDPRQFARWIAALDDPRYTVRDSATKAIADRGDAAMPALRAALKKPLSPEARRRLEFLLDPLYREPTSEEVLRSRAIQVLELGASSEARHLLQVWSEGAEGSGLTEAARAALVRLKRRGLQ